MQVPCQSLTRLVHDAGFAEPTVLFLDVEGNEAAVLGHVDPAIFDAVVMEVLPQYGKEPSHFKSSMSQLERARHTEATDVLPGRWPDYWDRLFLRRGVAPRAFPGLPLAPCGLRRGERMRSITRCPLWDQFFIHKIGGHPEYVEAQRLQMALWNRRIGRS